MRHGKKVNHLGRKSEHRKAMLSNMACSLIEHKRISTTVAKAKALRVYVEPLITKSKTDSTHSRRTVFSYLKNKEVVAELFREVAPKVVGRPGGYTRIIRTGYRLGDNAEMCMIELVDFNELMLNNAEPKKTTRRSRRGGTTAPKAATPAADADVEVADAPAADEVEDAVIVEETVAETPADEAPAVEEAPATEEAAPEASTDAPADEASEDNQEEEKA